MSQNPFVSLTPARDPEGFFVSDLHLFSRRSSGPLHLSAIHAAAKTAKKFVLGGDIFDFRWSTHRSPTRTVEAAVRWLDDLVAPHQHCEFQFVLGNHDTNASFIEALDEFSRTMPNLNWHHYYVRIGENLFLHGDIADRERMNHELLAKRRSKYLHERQRGEVLNLLYDAAVRARLHRLTATVRHSKRRVARRLQSYLTDLGHGPDTGVRRVYFGHTHVPMIDYEFNGLVFNNGGASIKGLPFRIVEF